MRWQKSTRNRGEGCCSIGRGDGDLHDILSLSSLRVFFRVDIMVALLGVGWQEDKVLISVMMGQDQGFTYLLSRYIGR